MQKSEHHLLLVWLIFTGLVIFLVTIGWQENIFSVLYDTDRSRISLAITILYLFVTLHCGNRIFVISTQINQFNAVESIIRENTSVVFNIQKNKVFLNEAIVLSDCIITDYIHDLINKSDNRKETNESDADHIEFYESKLKAPHETGWFIADIMIKLGLLGTIIGFILMLGSVANITDFDVTTMQKILRHMSSGMGTALYTTLTGLVCSLLVSMQYQMLDSSADDLIESIRHLTRVYVLPRLS